MKILVLNAGSSSQKACLYEMGDALPQHPLEPQWEGQIEWSGDRADLRAKNSRGIHLEDQVTVPAGARPIGQLLDNLWTGKLEAAAPPAVVDVVAHRIVNGGPDYRNPTWVTPEVKAAIARMAAMAPLHNSAGLDGMDFIERRFGVVPQAAVFDTGFHRHLPEAAYVYPGPYEWLAQGIRRYGFHGINHQYCAERSAQLVGKDLASLRLVTCHLGNGCSLAPSRRDEASTPRWGLLRWKAS